MSNIPSSNHRWNDRLRFWMQTCCQNNAWKSIAGKEGVTILFQSPGKLRWLNTWFLFVVKICHFVPLWWTLHHCKVNYSKMVHTEQSTNVCSLTVWCFNWMTSSTLQQVWSDPTNPDSSLEFVCFMNKIIQLGKQVTR